MQLYYYYACSFLFILEAWLEAYVIGLKSHENTEELIKLDKGEHKVSAIWAFFLTLVLVIPIWGNWFLIAAFIPLRRIFFDTTLPVFRNWVLNQNLRLLAYPENPKGVDKFMKGLFRRRWVELAIEIIFTVTLLIINHLNK